MAEALVGIIGGSGVDQIEGLVNQEWREVNSPFGCPSDKLLFGQIMDKPIVFLPRHGRGHRLSPSSINYRANIDALKRSWMLQRCGVGGKLSVPARIPLGVGGLVA